ncbi:MAG: hypothetical protein IT583_01300 [Verrucomicrobia bacterium]|nr:hypothetical protein [Verrucomicrobiota bacterium]
MALGQGIDPHCFARGLLVAARFLDAKDPIGCLDRLWTKEQAPQVERDQVIQWLRRQAA